MKLSSALLLLSIIIVNNCSVLKRKHRNRILNDFGDYSVLVLPVLEDNYMYILIDKATNLAAAVDPVLPEILWPSVRGENLNLTTVLVTHHHRDHADGLRELIRTNDSNNTLKIIGGDSRIYGVTIKVHKTPLITRLGSLKIKTMRTPGHTTGHVCFYIDEGPGVVFTGDTLFLGGCGRLAEGNATQMYNVLYHQLATLPNSTYVFGGHEYSVQNLRFAEVVEPYNKDVSDMLSEAITRRKIREPSVPSTIEMEKLINPFMRLDKFAVQNFTKSFGDPIRTLELLKAYKMKPRSRLAHHH